MDQPGFLWVLQRDGTLRTDPALVLTNRMAALRHGAFDERGLLDVVLHPQFPRNRRIFVTYSAPRRETAPADWDSTLRVAEFLLPAEGAIRVDPASEKILLEIDKPYANHNSGRLAFGPDGFLYIGVGDGGNAHDHCWRRPESGNGQNLRTHLGKVLRVDINAPAGGSRTASPLTIRLPTDEALPEIYAYGLRNPWGLSFDRGSTHELFAADVGQDLLEEVDILRKGAGTTVGR